MWDIFNRILRGGLVLPSKALPINSLLVKLHKNAIICVLEIYFTFFFNKTMNYQEVMRSPFDYILEYSTNYVVKLLSNQKYFNVVKNQSLATKFVAISHGIEYN